MGGDHDGMIGEGDVEGWGRRAFVGVWGTNGEEVSSGTSVEDGRGGVGWWGGT